METLLQDIKDFVATHILTSRGSTYLYQANVLEMQAWKYLQGCCVYDEKLYELEYYLKLLNIIQTRLRLSMTQKEDKSKCCTSLSYRSNSPIVVYDNRFTLLMKMLINSSLAVGGLLQFVRTQIDGGLSAWSQVCFIVAAFIGIVYFYTTKQYSFTLPQIGSLIITILQLEALIRHSNDVFSKW